MIPFADVWDHTALACRDTCCLCVCVVSDGKVSDLLVCWTPMDHDAHSPSGPFSLPQASTVAVGLSLLRVFGISVSKGSVMFTSWFGTVPGSVFAVPVCLSLPALSL